MTEVDLADSPSPSIHAPALAEQTGVCPRCGSRIAGRELAVETAAESPIVDPHATRRDAGLLALLLLCAPSAVPAGTALALLANDEWIAGFILVVLALVYAVLLLMTVEREPDAPLGCQALAVAARAQLRARMACVSVAAWSRALRALVRVRRRQQRLYAARKDRLAALGEAILRGDRAHAARLKAETRNLGEEMQARDHEASVAISAAREQIERERVASRADAARVG
jgi:hypothetical protein